MGRPFLVEYDDERPSSDYVLCRTCGTRVAFIQDFIDIEDEPTCVPQGIFIKIFNVEVPTEKPYQQVVDGKALADTYCIICRDRLGWKFIAVPQGSGYYEGQFLMKLVKVSDSDGQPLSFFDQEEDINEQVPNEQDGGTNEENADQGGGNNEENPDQDGGANEQVPNEQDGGANEDNADQGGGINEQDGGANEDNADQGGGINEQDGGTNEQVANGHY